MKKYQITIIDKGRRSTLPPLTKKEKMRWLYKYLTHDEKVWAWQEWNNSGYKSFDKWFKVFTKQVKKNSSFQFLLIKDKTILIKQVNE